MFLKDLLKQSEDILAKSDKLQKDAGQIKTPHLADGKMTRPDQQVKRVSGGDEYQKQPSLRGHQLVHAVLKHIHATQGTKAGNQATSELLSLIHPEDHDNLNKSLSAAGFSSHPHHTITHLRTLMISPKHQKAFHQGKSRAEAKESQGRLKKSWSAMLGACKEIHGSLSKSDDTLAKGALRREAPFNPQKDISSQDNRDVQDWVVGATPYHREKIAPLTGNARIRGLNKLRAKTETRKNPATGEIEHKLHRGMSSRELSGHQANSVKEKTSWTPDLDTAHRFASLDQDSGKVASAWVPEKHIHHLPYMHGHDSEIRANREEHEVVVNPHKMNLEVNEPRDLEQNNSKEGIKAVAKRGGRDAAQAKIKANLAGKDKY